MIGKIPWFRQRQDFLDRVARAIDRGRRYISTMKWLVHKGFFESPTRFWSLVGLSIISLLAQAMVIGLIFFYIRSIEKNVFLAGVEVNFEWLRSYWGLLIFVVVLATLLGLNHFTIYRVRMMALKYMCEVEIDLGRLALFSALQLPNLSCRESTAKATNRGLLMLMSRDVRYCGLTVRLIALTLPVIIALIGSLVGLLYLDWLISGLFIASGAVIFLFQYPANLMGATATRRWQSIRPKAVKTMADAISHLRLGGQAKSNNAKQSPSDLFSEPSVIESINAYADRSRAIEIGTLSTQFGTTFLTVVIILIIGSRVLADEVDWALLAAYISLLRVASGNFASLTRYTTSIARLYPQVMNYVNFMTDFDRCQLQGAVTSDHWRLNIKVSGGKDIAEAENSEIIEPHELTALVTLDSPKLALPEFAVALSSSIELIPSQSVTKEEANLQSDFCVHEKERVSGGPVIRIMSGRLQTDAKAAHSLVLSDHLITNEWPKAIERLSLRSFELGKSIEILRFLEFEKPFDKHVIDDRLELVAQITAAMARKASVIIIEREALKKLGCESKEDPLIQELMHNCLVFIWYQQLEIANETFSNFNERKVVVCKGNAVDAVLDLTESKGREQLFEIISTTDRNRYSVSKLSNSDFLDEPELEG